MQTGFLKAGYFPILSAAFLYFDLGFMARGFRAPAGRRCGRPHRGSVPSDGASFHRNRAARV
jgi:hypothetical protein